MRAATLALIAALACAGCMSRPPHHDRSGEVSYNRRELPPEPGLFTGPDGVWTVYDSTRSPEDPAEADDRGPCGEEGRACEPGAEPR